MRKLTIEKMGDLAERKGGKCLSCVYVGNTVKLNWQCANGHQFLSKSNDVQQGHWCLQCYNKRRKRRIDGFGIVRGVEPFEKEKDGHEEFFSN